MKSGEIRFSQQRPLQHRDPDMTPTITSAMTYSEEHLTLTHKLRKPQVEKLRRERINSSIEQLKSLLGPEILKQQPDSKMEKADILEMTVCFLRQLQQYQPVNSSCSAAVNQGYSRCVQEMVHFLSKDEMKTQSQRRLLNHFQNLQSSSDMKMCENDTHQLFSPVQSSITKDKSPDNRALWRPW
ncbi:transcription factor HES-5-like [Polymixia lowei]